ncbi:MAG: hypothetical protein IPL99_24065 [Candidatus Competibacteraceae bacterium]|nr:hypothetical protein [Candidatus Competibacteraceae bacterium]
MTAEIATMTRMHLKPRLIFDRCVDFLIQRRVQVPKAAPCSGDPLGTAYAQG